MRKLEEDHIKNLTIENNVKNLQVGQTVKNYKELCKLLGLEPTTGNAKIAQMKDINRYIRYEKSGQKFIISEIYGNPIHPEPRMANNSKYILSAQEALCSYLYRCTGIVYLSKTQLMSILGLVNDKYRLYISNKTPLLELHSQMDYAQAAMAYNRISSRGYNIIKTCLDSMMRRGIIVYYTCYSIIDGDTQSRYVPPREATWSEMEYIEKTEAGVLEELGVTSVSACALCGKMGPFYQKLGKIYREEKGWSYVMKCYRIDFDKRHLPLGDPDAAKKEVNQIFYDWFIHDTIRITSQEHEDFTYPPKTQDMQHILADHLIKI